jgi:hypothetical protein
VKKKFSEHLAEEAKKKPSAKDDYSKQIQTDGVKPSETNPIPKIKDVKIDSSKFVVAIVKQEEPGKIKVKVEKNVYTFTEDEVSALKTVLDDVVGSGFSSTGKMVNVFRAEKNFVFQADSYKTVMLTLVKSSDKVLGSFVAYQDMTQDRDNNIYGGGSYNYRAELGSQEIVPIGVNGQFEFVVSELQKPDELTHKLCVAFSDYASNLDWAKNDEDSWKAYIAKNTANDEINYGESVSKFSKHVLGESSFGDALADAMNKVFSVISPEDGKDFYQDLIKTVLKFAPVKQEQISQLSEEVKSVYSSLKLEEAKDFYLNIQKMVAKYSFMASKSETNEPIEPTGEEEPIDGGGGEEQTKEEM